MKRTIPFLLTLALAVPALGATQPSHGREQSYFTYDDGGTILKQGDDGRDVEARVNLPVYPGDEITTSRRGRTEIRLSDGNIMAFDRDTQVLMKSILDSYDGDNSQTVVELRYGHVAIQRTDRGGDLVRLDTKNASYVAVDEALYAVEADVHGKDRVMVFDGSIEIRTPSRTVRIRSGEEARVDDQGMYGLVSAPRGSGDEFERWFQRRSERSGTSSRYLDSSIAYSDPDLAENGSWVYVSGVSTWCWRPRVTAGWRPYYHGYWHTSPSGCLVWVSDEPWGWAPYHYGRWAYDPLYGWVWLPGSSYAPAWVYWMYGPSYVGWAPMGWYDCYRPYYDWAYRPYQRASVDFGWGFYGRVRVNDIDLRPWTFVSPNHIVSTRVDRAALTTDVIRDRVRRDPGAGLATVGSAPARFSRSDLKDPSTAVNNIIRRGIGSGTGKEGSGSAADMTPFFRRDPEISKDVRERIVRSRPAVSTPPPSSGGGYVTSGGGAPSGVPTPGTAGTIEGRVSRDGGGSRGDTPVNGVPRGTLHRGDNPSSPTSPTSPAPGTTSGSGGSVDRFHRDQPSTERSTPTWRDHVDRPASPPSSTVDTPPVDRTTPPPSDNSNWRGRSVSRGGEGGSSSTTPPPSRGSGSDTPSATTPDRSGDRGSSIPRRIIDRIGGARVSGDGGGSSRGGSSGSSGSSGGSGRGSSGSGSSGSSSPPPQRSSPPPPPPQRSEPPPPPAEHHSSDSGKVKRN